MQVEFINPFIETIITILNTMAKMTCAHGQPYLKEDAYPLGDVTSVIALQGDVVEGSLAISFATPTIIGITRSMLGEDVDQLDDSCTSLAGELANMLSGGARKLLWERGYSFDMATPTLQQGQVLVEHLAPCPVIVIPFDSKYGAFFIEVALHPRLQKASLPA